MIIDSHQHFWNYDPVRDSWIDNTMSVLKKDFLPNDLEPLLKKKEIDGCIAVQADQSENETEFLLNFALKKPFIKGVVGWVDLLSKNLNERLLYYSKNPFFKGVRHIVQAEKDDYLLREDVQNGINKLTNYNLTFDILIYPSQIPSAIELVKKFTKQKFILDHIGKPNISKPPQKSWKENIIKLAKNQNVFCKLSGLVTETKNYNFKDDDFVPYIDFIFQNFGPDRIMFGSDWPVCLLAADYSKVFDLIFTYIESHSKNSIRKVLGENAIKVYNL